jgi:hypothetical protein
MDNEIPAILQEMEHLFYMLKRKVSSYSTPAIPQPSKFIEKSEWMKLSAIPGTPEYQQRQQWKERASIPGTKEHSQRQAWLESNYGKQGEEQE